MIGGRTKLIIIVLEKKYVSCIQYGLIFEYGSFWSCLVRQYGCWAGPIQPPRALANQRLRSQRTPSRGYISREMFSQFIFPLQPRRKAAPRNATKPLARSRGFDAGLLGYEYLTPIKCKSMREEIAIQSIVTSFLFLHR